MRTHITRTMLLLIVMTLTRFPETAPIRASDCDNANTPSFAKGDVVQVNHGQAQNVRAQPTTHANIIASVPQGEYLTVWNGPECADGYTWWRVNYGQQVGWTAEAPQDGGSAWLSKVEMNVYEAGNVRLSAPESLVTALTFVDWGEGGGDGFSTPPNRALTLEGFPVMKGREDLKVWPPGFNIYPCALSQESDMTPNCRLDRLVGGLPQMPDLVAFSTVPQTHTASSYFAFRNGRGVCQVFDTGTPYSYRPPDTFMRYSFTALTSDGTYEIIVGLPIVVDWTPPLFPLILPMNTGLESRTFFRLYESYSMAASKALIDLPPEAFTPRLALLDAMMRSIEIVGPINLKR